MVVLISENLCHSHANRGLVLYYLI